MCQYLAYGIQELNKTYLLTYLLNWAIFGDPSRLGRVPKSLQRRTLMAISKAEYCLQARCPSCRPNNSVNALKALSTRCVNELETNN